MARTQTRLADNSACDTSMIKSGITQEEVIGWGGADVFNQALHLCNSNAVRDVHYDDDTLIVSGKIEQSDGWEMPVSFKLKEGGKIHSECPCAINQRYGMVCPHVVALGLALSILEQDDEEAPASPDEEAATPSEKKMDFIEVPMSPSFYLMIYGTRATLSVELDAYYGEINFPACSMQSERVVYLEDPNDDMVRRVRSLKEEKAAIDELKKWGFAPGYKEGDQRLYMTDQQKLLTFLGAGYPMLRRRANWKIELSERLAALYDTFKNIIPVVRIKDAPDGDFDVNYTFEADGEEVSPIEIQAALNRNDGCLLKDGKVYLLDNHAIELMHDTFRDCAVSQGNAPKGWFRVKGIHAAYVKTSLDELLDVIDIDDSEAQSWRDRAGRKCGPEAKFEPIALGELDGILRPYQKQGVYWMRFLEEAGISGLLADEMGLGKTLQTLTWLSLPCANNRVHHPALIVCPTSLVRNWEAEAKKFTPWLKTLVISGANRESLFNAIDNVDIVITSYALLQRDFEDAYLPRRFSATIIDEAQHIKNHDTKNARLVKLINADRRLALTGTPIENSVTDVWSIFDFLMPGYLGDYEAFKTNFENPIRDGDNQEALARLKRKLEPFIMRRVKKMVAKDLPDKIIKVSYCPMSDDAQREYCAALAKTRTLAGNMVRTNGLAKSKFEILAMLMKLRQISSRAKKSAFMEQLLSAIAGGHKILVFSQFVTTLKLLQEELRANSIPFCYLDGSTKDRLGECNRFNRSADIPVFLISLMAGGTGLNLTSADMVMHYDPWWNPAVEDQATDRAHRIGQRKTVYVIKMIAAGSIEEKVLTLQRRKQAIIAATINTTDQSVMESLTAADLNELLS